jgi:hypothetical protein
MRDLQRFGRPLKNNQPVKDVIRRARSEHALITKREETGGSELSKLSYTLLGMVKFDLTEKGRKLAENVIPNGS